jgi:ferritin-like metal-binding protein YciE
MNTLAELFEDQLKDLYSAEQQLIKALPKMAKAASSPELKEAMNNHLAETEEHARRLQQIAESIGIKPTGKTCAGMKGLIAEGSEAMQEDGDDIVIDGALIAAAQRVEHYEVSGYGTAKALAKQIGLDDEIVQLLEQTMDEESATDEKLTEIAEQAVYPNAATDEGEEDDTEMAASGSSSSSRRGGSSRGRRGGTSRSRR